MCGVYLFIEGLRCVDFIFLLRDLDVSIKGLRCEEFIFLLRDIDVRSLSLY